MFNHSTDRRIFIKRSATFSVLSAPLLVNSFTFSSKMNAAIDVGTSEIRIALIGKDQAGLPKLTAYGTQKNEGLKNGIIENTDEVSHRISKCIDSIQDAFKVKIIDVVSALPGVTISGKTNLGGFDKLTSTLKSSNITLRKIFLKNQVAADAVLTSQDVTNGVLVIDIGAGTTSYSFYAKGKLIQALTLPLGGDLITSDLAMAIRSSTALAEKIKVDLSSIPNLTGFDFKVPALNGGSIRKLNAAVVPQIIEPRITEIFELISHAKKQLGSDGGQIKSVVLTGGTSLSPSISKISSEVFVLPTRLGTPTWSFITPDLLAGPRFSVLAGMAKSIL